MPKPIVINGAGGIVRDAHLPAYAKIRLTVCGVTDLKGQRRAVLAADFGIGRVFASVGEAVAAFGTSVVYYIAVPPSAIAAVLSTLPQWAAVLIQKPMGADLNQARAIRATCRARNLKAAVNFQLRFSPMMMMARRDERQSQPSGQAQVSVGPVPDRRVDGGGHCQAGAVF